MRTAYALAIIDLTTHKVIRYGVYSERHLSMLASPPMANALIFKVEAPTYDEAARKVREHVQKTYPRIVLEG